jgi:hypothetical protein
VFDVGEPLLGHIGKLPRRILGFVFAMRLGQ